MSRYGFGEILGSAELPEQQDLKGYRLEEWLDFAVVGWDEPLQTYFVQGPEEDDELSWWLGTTYAEIPTFAMLCRLIELIFGDSVPFEFVDRIDTVP